MLLTHPHLLQVRPDPEAAELRSLKEALKVSNQTPISDVVFRYPYARLLEMTKPAGTRQTQLLLQSLEVLFSSILP
eukprot:3005336-Amphidinium_carterae.3